MYKNKENGWEHERNEVLGTMKQLKEDIESRNREVENLKNEILQLCLQKNEAIVRLEKEKIVLFLFVFLVLFKSYSTS